MVGGIGEVREADDEVQGILNEFKSEIEGKVGRSVPELTLVNYKTQLVAGMNYFAKVKIGGDEHIHVRIYKTLQGEKSLTSLQTDKKHEDAIEYF